MFAKKTAISLLGARRQSKQANSNFILKVREVERHRKILQDVFMRSSAENPYHKRIEASLPLYAAVADEMKRQQTTIRKNMIHRKGDDNSKEVENKIRAENVAKSIAAQRREAQQVATEEKARTNHSTLELRNSRLSINDEIGRHSEERDRKARLKRDLKGQMSLPDVKRQRENVSKLKDKRLMEFDRKYKEDPLKELQSVHQKKVKFKKETNKNSDVQNHQKQVKLLGKQKEERLIYFQARKLEKIQKALRSEEIGKQIHNLRVKKNSEFDHRFERIGERREKESIKCVKDKELKACKLVDFRDDLISLRKLREQQKNDEERLRQELYHEEQRFRTKKDALQRIADGKKQNQVQSYRQALLDNLSEKKHFKVNEIKRFIMPESSHKEAQKKSMMTIKNLQRSYTSKHVPALQEFLYDN